VDTLCRIATFHHHAGGINSKPIHSKDKSTCRKIRTTLYSVQSFEDLKL
jgi:hypothetical protein